ncbi:MAG: dienelactone hydrolase family protein, partial [Rhizobiaceae bacterium]
MSTVSISNVSRSILGLGRVAALVFLGTPTALSQNITPQTNAASDTAVGRPFDAPVNTLPVSKKWWWSDAWYDKGLLEVPTNHSVEERQVSYTNSQDGTEVPAVVFKPDEAGKYPAVLFQHGRRGLDDIIKRLARRMAARGFVVLAPDVYSARFIEQRPIDHLEETESDVNAGLDFLLSLPEVSTSRACLYSHTRGGYYTLRVTVTFNRQKEHVACYVSFYPHWQNPSAPEPMQVYRYAPEIDGLNVPSMVFIGEYEQYQRRRSIETAVRFMKQAGKDVKLVIYPGVGRGFDFRPPNVRTFADDLATKDSNLRAAAFM